MMEKGVVIGGSIQEILVRQKSKSALELGEIVGIKHADGKILARVVDIGFGSSQNQQTIEMVSGIRLEEDTEIEFSEPSLKYYNLAKLKPLLYVQGTSSTSVKTIPPVFSEVEALTVEDLKFLGMPLSPLRLGFLRSGSLAEELPIYCNGAEMLVHHVLIAATTGRGKSNLTSCLLWELASHDYGGVLVLDPHDEYFGRTKVGLKDHPKARDKVVYYTVGVVPSGQRSLKFNLAHIRPGHLDGALPWTDPQREALTAFYRKYKDKWVEAILVDSTIDGFHEATLGVLRRRLRQLLDIQIVDGALVCEGVFDPNSGLTTIRDIVNDLEQGKLVIVDTSSFASSTEILIGSILAGEIFNRYRYLKLKGDLASKPVISIVVEEAPRVLGKQVLEQGPNVFSSIAREGRKFKVGLIAITQLPSLIPRDILANLNTKIILGLEMKPERIAIIESAAQDLSSDERHIAALDVGEAVVTSHLLRFATPLRIPYFESIVKASQLQKKEVKIDFRGVGIG